MVVILVSRFEEIANRQRSEIWAVLGQRLVRFRRGLRLCLVLMSDRLPENRWPLKVETAAAPE